MSKITPTILISQIYKSRKNILDIMGMQDYNINEYDSFSINEVNAMHKNNQLDMLLEKTIETKLDNESSEVDEISNQKIYIRYYLGKKININTIQEIIDDLFNLSDTLNNKYDTLFIIIKEEVNESINNIIKHIWEKDNIYIVIENIYRLQFNILKHDLVPRHYIMSDNDISNMMNKYNIKCKSELPEISRFDPVSKLICLRPNQVCRIARPSKSALVIDYYRVCV